MRELRALLMRLAGLFRKERRERELTAELESHLQFHIEDNQHAGMSPEEARRQALIKLGGMEQTKELYRDRSGVPWLETLVQDLRYGFRTLRKAPGFTAVAVVTLALGIGANSAIFSTISGILLRKPTVAHPEQVMMLLSVSRSRGLEDSPERPASAPDFVSWREQTRAFSGLAAMDAWHDYTFTGQGLPEHVMGMRVSANFFQLMGVAAARGRTFLPGEDQPGREHEVILSHGLWERKFSADPSILGKRVDIDGQTCTVIGVMPAWFNLWIFGAQAWTPLAFTPEELSGEERKSRSFFVLGRLAEGVTVQQAQAEMNTIARRLEQTYAAADKGWETRLLSLQEFEVRDAEARPALLLLMAAVGFVLLVACANIAGLLIARGSGRQQEIAIRTALGARRLRLVRQLLAENLLICALGTGLGLSLAYAGIRVLRAAFSFNQIVAGISFGLDNDVLIFTVALAILSLLVFGLAPALQLTRPNLQPALRESSRTGSAGKSRMRMRQALVVGEIALSLVLLTGAGLMIRLSQQKIGGDHGFNPRQVLTAEVALSSREYSDPARQRAFFQQLIEHVRGLAGVQAASAASSLPTGLGTEALSFAIAGRPPLQESDRPRATYYIVTPGYFSTMQIPLLQGRTFMTSDNASAPPVATVNREFVRQFFPSGNALGQHISVSNDSAGRPVWREIIGVVGNVDEWVGQSAGHPQVYATYLQFPAPRMSVAVRSATAVSTLAPALRQAVWDTDRNQPVSSVMTMEEVMYSQGGGAGSRIIEELLGIFAGVALILATVGIYGVISYLVLQRTHEIGIRVALGAAKRDILRLVMSEGARLAVLGLVFGGLGAAAVPNVLASAFRGFAVSPWLVFITALTVIAGVALGACYIPARRAARVDPIVALRYE
ncbi:MAG TPA: ABC transporter permease [Terriglobales bacterium]|nr:ABC transporter permease [Terriglobales bacterium]